MKDKCTLTLNVSSNKACFVARGSTAGFTLIEILVSIGLFSVVMLIGLTALLSLTSINKKAQTSRKIVDNVTFILEDMTRNIRLGQNYHCGTAGAISAPQDCTSSGDTYLAFEGLGGDMTSLAKDDDQVVYRFDDVEKKIEKSINGGTNFSSISSTNIRIDNLRFYVTGSSFSDLEQSRVLIVLQATVSPGTKEASIINLQTTVSERYNDF